MPALHKAAKDGDELSIRELCSYGADVNEKATPKKTTALHLVARQGNEATVRMLLECGADVNAKSFSYNPGRRTSWCGDEKTALHWAARNGFEHIVQLLIDYGADISARSTTLRTSLHLASARGFFEAAGVLIRNGALLDAQDISGWTPLHHASSLNDYGKALELLKIGECLSYHGANIEANTFNSPFISGPRTSLLLAVRGRSPFQWGSCTPLLLAIRGRFVPMTQLLIETGANLLAQDSGGWTALYHAAVAGCDMITRILLDAIFDAGYKSSEVEAALEYAASNGDGLFRQLLSERLWLYTQLQLTTCVPLFAVTAHGRW